MNCYWLALLLGLASIFTLIKGEVQGSIRTLNDAPTLPPENVKCFAVSSQSLRISWEPPLPEGRKEMIQGYKVTYHRVDESVWLDDRQAKITQSMNTTITDLRKYTNYSITVLAFTSSEGVRSEPVYCHTEEDVPSAPADIKAMLSAPNKILVLWLRPKYSNGELIYYTFYMSNLEDGHTVETHKKVLGSTVESHEVNTSKESAAYQFWVTASTRVGEGESTRTVTVTPSEVIPARIPSFGREILSEWKQTVSLPCKPVGDPLPVPVWHLNELPVEVGGRRSISSATLQIRDVQTIDQGNYSCSVANQHGTDKIIYSLKVLLPPESPTLTVVSSFSDSLLLSWVGKENGDSAILGYIINYKSDYGDWEQLQISAQTDEYMLRHLWCGTRYRLFVTAFNRIGNSLPSEIVTTQTKGTVPVKPSLSQMLTINSTVVTVRLDSWNNGGCEILYFVMEYKKQNDSSWILVTNNAKPTKRVYSVTELLPNTDYNLRISAHNNVGYAVVIYNFTTLAGAPVKPKLSQMLTVNNATVVTVPLDSWGDGGSEILYFVIDYKRQKDSSWIPVTNNVKPTERIYSITKLSPDTDYHLRVSAHNNIGYSVVIYNFTTLAVAGGNDSRVILPLPLTHSHGQHFFTNSRVVPTILSILVLLGVFATLFWRQKIRREREDQRRCTGECPQIQNIRN